MGSQLRNRKLLVVVFFRKSIANVTQTLIVVLLLNHISLVSILFSYHILQLVYLVPLYLFFLSGHIVRGQAAAPDAVTDGENAPTRSNTNYLRQTRYIATVILLLLMLVHSTWFHMVAVKVKKIEA